MVGVFISSAKRCQKGRSVTIIKLGVIIAQSMIIVMGGLLNKKLLVEYLEPTITKTFFFDQWYGIVINVFSTNRM